MKFEIGAVYQKTAKGCYYFRYQINGQRKAVSLKTRNQKEAIKKAQELVPVVKSTTTEMIFAHVNIIFINKLKDLYQKVLVYLRFYNLSCCFLNKVHRSLIFRFEYVYFIF